ncbi:MAG TPA: winged helix-turn-helix transcriptional regulator [Solirubrobacterales bacterium]
MNRAGAQALALLAGPLNVHMLKALEDGPLPLLDLRRAVGTPPNSTMRNYTKALEELSLIERRRLKQFPASAEYAITAAGRALLGVGNYLQEWLMAAPDGPILLGSTAAKNATKALLGGWSVSIVRALAARPLSLTELNIVVPKVSYPSLERKFSPMRVAKLIEPRPGQGRAIPYGSSEWLRLAVIPLVAAVNWEQRFLAERAAPIGRLDVEAAFLLALPLTELGPEVSGRCRLIVEVRRAPAPVHAGALADIKEGSVACSSRLEGDADATACGTPLDWLGELNGGPRGRLEISGDASLAAAVTGALRSLPDGLVRA